MSTLLLMTIGPVQDFIVAARTTRDLWFGSRLLAQVGRQIAITLRDSGAGVELIFPAPEALANAEVAVPNRIFAKVKHGEVEPFVDQARRAAGDELHRWRRRVEQELAGNRGAVDWILMERQVDEVLELYAAWVPYDERFPDCYGALRAKVERLLAGRKALRNFAAPTGMAGRAKSSLDPSRESVLLSHGQLTGSLQWRVRPNEPLDALSLIRRVGTSEPFPAISRVAIDPFIRRISAEPAIDGLIAAVQDKALMDAGEVTRLDTTGRWRHYRAFPFNTTLLYDEGRVEGQADSDTKQAAQEFYTAANDIRQKLNIGGFPDYFAILIADGDRMGKLIGQLDGPDEHRRLSAGLANFSRQAEAIVSAHHGALIYSGGDDVLAFLPLDTALDCANALRQDFARIVGNAASGQPATLSAGLAIVHAVEHLQHALTWARAAEQVAKRTRNSLAVAFHTRSGGGHHLTVSHSWESNPVSSRWQHWIEYFHEGALSTGSLYELRALGRELRGQTPEVVAALLPLEAGRILRRKKQRDGTPVSDTAVEHLSKAFGTSVPSLEATVNELLIARRIAAVVEISRTTPSAAVAGT
ncbi:MAG: type III-B CRISPR-associated protein Cas10/Cmr2 [Chloroflexota bacterium]|nr:type III-B CRISPR-associated protein Cas10/Cmr2 [Chloroflexota bacterium]